MSFSVARASAEKAQCNLLRLCFLDRMKRERKRGRGSPGDPSARQKEKERERESARERKRQAVTDDGKEPEKRPTRRKANHTHSVMLKISFGFLGQT